MDAHPYQGREQTYAKHLFLKLYLERVAFKIAYLQPDFVYVDGFSGPWQSAGQDLEDTSFMIAIRKLQYVRDALEKVGKKPQMRCLFIEADKARFKALESATETAARVRTEALFGEFEALTSEILRFIGNGFSLVFIDPTGWEGFAMDLIRPILERRRGEVIVNFMFDYINRFVNDVRPEIEDSFNRLFGTTAWRHLRTVQDREDIVHFYCEQLRTAGSYRFTTFTPIFKPLSDRAYFHLIYCTRSIKGLIEFRECEKKSIPDREKVRNHAQQTARISRTGQFELYGATEIDASSIFGDYRACSLRRARAAFVDILKPGSTLTYEELLGRLLVLPYVWQSDVKDMLTTARKRGEVVIEGLSPRSRTPRLDAILRVCKGLGPYSGSQ
jgi:three-Cys-motif partner protein